MSREDRLETAIMTIIDYIYSDDVLSKSYMISVLAAAIARPEEVRHAILDGNQSPHVTPPRGRRKKP